MKKLLLIIGLFTCVGLQAQTLKMNSDLLYAMPHGVGSADSVIASIGGTQNVYYKINPTFTAREQTNITLAADTATIAIAGDYEVWVFAAITTSNANDQIRVKMYVNSVPLVTSLGRFIINSGGTGVYRTTTYMWYKTFAVGDKISFYGTNLSGARAFVVGDFKIYIKKVPG